MLQQVISVSLLTAMAAMSPASSQGIRQGASISGTTYVAPATPVLVATPYPSSPGDSAAAVQIGNAVRDKLSNKIGSEWRVLTRIEMNRNFQQWGYNPDQLFPPDAARQVASAMSARMFVMTTMTKGSDGLFNASIRVTGIADDAGQVGQIKQVAGQSSSEFGGKIADQITIVFKAYPDAKACNDNLVANKTKAVESANKALKVVPNYGLAENCLGLLEWSKDSVGPETVRHFKNATIGDPLSLRAVNRLAIISQLKHDTVGVIESYQRMITIAPTNQPLASEAIKIFKLWGRPDAADQVVAQQRQLDPTSADWPHLQGTSCAAAGVTSTNPDEIKKKYACAYAAFVEEIKLDPTRADTNFFPMIVFVAGTRADSLEWGRKWATKAPNSADPYKLMLQIFMDAGQADSAKTAIRMLTAIDPTDARPVLALEQELLKQKRYDDAMALASLFPKGADATPRDQFAGLLVQEGQTLVADTANKTEAKDSTLAHLGRAIVAFNPPNVVYTEMGNYFIVSSYAPAFVRLSTAVRADKSCETYNKYEAVINAMDAEPALKALATATTPSLVQYHAQLAPAIQGEKGQLPAMKKAFCKP